MPGVFFSSLLASMLSASSNTDSSSALPLSEWSSGAGTANNGVNMASLDSLLLEALLSGTSLTSGTGTNLNSLLPQEISSSSLSPAAASTAGAPALSADKTAANGSYSDIINQMGKKYDVDPKLIQSVIKQESGGHANATSAAGAQGLMQLMPATSQALGVTDPYDPKQNIEGGTKYLKQLLDHFNGDKRLAVAAYNAGTASVEKYNGIPPYSETQAYVNNVLSTYNS
ncbi:lytic transglycosylase domain-containing protein [Terrilactibacillus sp. S3-3]|nr:lytic transglycosylase domain-containing protein [Terrilactibacillus sp. S3-3]